MNTNEKERNDQICTKKQRSSQKEKENSKTNFLNESKKMGRLKTTEQLICLMENGR